MTHQEAVIAKYPSAKVILSLMMGENRGDGDYDEKLCFLIVILGNEHFAKLGKIETISTGSCWILGYGDTEEEAWEYAATREERLRGKWVNFMVPYVDENDIHFTADAFRKKYTFSNRRN